MSIFTALARPFLAVPFVTSGVDALRHPHEHVEIVERINPTLEKLGVGPLSENSIVTLTRISGGVRVAAGACMAFGKKPRLAALTLAATEIPLGLARNPIWLAENSEEKKSYLPGLATSLGLAGGALVAAGDRRGKPSLGWRLENRRDHKADLSDLADRYQDKMDAKAEKYAAKIEKLKDKASN